jgi:hypothetical protein
MHCFHIFHSRKFYIYIYIYIINKTLTRNGLFKIFIWIIVKKFMSFWPYGFDDNNDEVDGGDNDRHHGHQHQLTVLCSIILHRSFIRLYPLGLANILLLL